MPWRKPSARHCLSRTTQLLAASPANGLEAGDVDGTEGEDPKAVAHHHEAALALLAADCAGEFLVGVADAGGVGIWPIQPMTPAIAPAALAALAIGSGPIQLHPLADPSTAPSREPAAQQAFRYEPLERFGEGLTTSRPWNTTALAGVERLNGRVAMVGFAAAVVGELLTGHGPAGQLLALLRWYLG